VSDPWTGADEESVGPFPQEPPPGSPEAVAQATEAIRGWRPFATEPPAGVEILAYRPDAGVFHAIYIVDDEGEGTWFGCQGGDLTGDPPTLYREFPAVDDPNWLIDPAAIHGFTPGPWAADRATEQFSCGPVHYHQIDAKLSPTEAERRERLGMRYPKTVCHTSDHDMDITAEEDAANAALIAHAWQIPEMLAENARLLARVSKRWIGGPRSTSTKWSAS